jgi:nitrite reductase/ring-hydroxylating ferredoxin subunit
VTTGQVVKGPATTPLGTYEVREQEGEIQVRITGTIEKVTIDLEE